MDKDEKLGGVSSEAVQARTGKTWAEWLAVLDAAGAAQMPHPQIARYLQDAHDVPDWWCQMITVGYEQARGLRQQHEKADGFAANASKTIGVSVLHLYEAWANDDQRRQWLPDAALTIRKATPGKSLRITWADGTDVDVNLTSRGEAKSQVAIQHSRLADAQAVATMKAYWRAGLEALKAFLEREGGGVLTSLAVASILN